MEILAFKVAQIECIETKTTKKALLYLVHLHLKAISNEEMSVDFWWKKYNLNSYIYIYEANSFE